jgi:hypothetical protein
MIVGFTGTRFGMTLEQKNTVWTLLQMELTPSMNILHHGDCAGADMEADGRARGLGYLIHIHPGYREGHPARAGCYRPGDLIERVQTPLGRNHVIVMRTEVLIAAPFEAEERQRSGTWATIRYARALGRRHHIVSPDGSHMEWKR